MRVIADPSGRTEAIEIPRTLVERVIMRPTAEKELQAGAGRRTGIQA